MITQKDLEKSLFDIALLGLDKCRSLIAGEELTGYGLVFDESFISIRAAGTARPVANEYFDLDNWELGPDISEMIDGNFLNELYEQCQDYDNDDYWHEEYQARVYLSAVTVLENLKSQEISSKDCVYLNVWVSDSDFNIKKGKPTVKRLNNRSKYEGFVTFLDSIA